MSKKLTVGKLKKALEGVPDELEVELESDNGVDQCDFEEDEEVVIEKAYRYTYQLPDGRTFDDTGDNKADYFVIYANYRDAYEVED